MDLFLRNKYLNSWIISNLEWVFLGFGSFFCSFHLYWKSYFTVLLQVIQTLVALAELIYLINLLFTSMSRLVVFVIYWVYLLNSQQKLQ